MTQAVTRFGISSVVLTVLLTVAPAGADVGDSCASRFPEVEWSPIRSGPVTVEVAGVPDGVAARFDREIGIILGWIEPEIGPIAVTTCIVDQGVGFDTSRFVEGSQRFHARMEMDERLLIIDTERVGFVGPAGAWALAHFALWQNGGDDPHPEPIASVVGQWYRARILDRLELYHRDVMVENFFQTEAEIDWTEGVQPTVRNWDPERNFQAIGDFVDFAVATYGTDVLLETDGARWSEIEGEWRVALRSDLTGRDTPTTEWIVGIGLAVGLLIVAAIAVILGVWSKRRRRRRPDTPPAIPGFFSRP